MTIRERARGAILVLFSHPNHYLMWGASAALSIILFVELAFGALLYQIILGVIGYSFDYTKDRVWRRSILESRRRMKNLYRFIAIGFASFSLLATGLGGLTVAEKIAPSSKRVDRAEEIAMIEADIASNKRDVAELKAQRDSLPADYTTAKLRYQDAINKLEEKGRDLVVRLAERKAGTDAPVVSSAKRMFEVVADRFHIGLSSVVFWFFIFFGFWLEVGNFATAPELDMKIEAANERAERTEKPAEPRPAPKPRPTPKPAEPVLSESVLERPVAHRRLSADQSHPDLFGDLNA